MAPDRFKEFRRGLTWHACDRVIQRTLPMALARSVRNNAIALTVDAQRRWAAGPLPGRTRRILLEGITCGSRSVVFPRLRTPHRP